MKTCSEKALEWNVTPRTVNAMCKNGRIQGAVKEKRTWLIPDDAEKPLDGRISTGKYSRKKTGKEKKTLPVGISDYVRAQSEYYYVDKTLLIKEFLDRKPLVSLFTRPRRFGKTLNMDMLRVFFEMSEDDTSKYFTDKAIWKCGEKYRRHQGKYPVIFLTFKDVKFDTWEATIGKIRGLLQEEYGRHQELLSSDRISQYEREYFEKILGALANDVELTSALERLSKMLTVHYGKAPIIIIDEYDTPIQEGYSKDFYDEIIGFMRIFFSGAFKDNKNLSYGFLTGILRIAQESIFSGLNNLSVNTVMDDEYDSFFGFTEKEIEKLLAYYGMSEKENELRDWYDGYLFGNEEIYNPWSVINYISKGCNYIVATDHEKLVNFCKENNIAVMMTSENCKSGTERCWDVTTKIAEKPDFIVNLQGDNPLCPPWFIEQLIEAWKNDKEGQVFTPSLHLSWEEYDRMKESKKITPYSGTTVEVDKFGYALAFSKAMIPVIRNEEKVRKILDKSPVRRHIGLYSYTYDALKKYFEVEASPYELPEGLEQMRFLHNRIPVKMIDVDYRNRKSMSGVDSPEDIERAEKIIAEFGEFNLSPE